MEIQPRVAWAAGCERLALVVHRPGESGHIRGRGCAVQVKPGIQIQSCHVSFAPGGGRAQGGRCKGEALFSTLSVWRAVDSKTLVPARLLPVCAQVLAVGWGPDYNGALDSTNSIICTPLSCTSSQGGKQWYLGTNQNSGTVYFVDYSPLYCNGDKGCGWSGSRTMNALVSGASYSERYSNMFIATSPNQLTF